VCIATEISGFERQGVVCRDHLRGVVCGGLYIGELAFGRHVELVDYLVFGVSAMGTTRSEVAEDEE
jgi:hypothetical protein